MAAVSLALAAFYVAHVYYFLVRRLLDRELMLSFTALSAFFVAVTIPLLLSHQWITPCWAIQALVMLWIAGKLESEFLRQVAYVLYAIVLVRFGFVDLSTQYSGGTAIRPAPGRLPVADGRAADDLRRSDRVAGGRRAGCCGRPRRSRCCRSAARTTSAPGSDRAMRRRAIAVVVVGMMFLALHLELNRSLGYFCEPLRLPVLSLLWVALCVFLLYEYRLRGSELLLGLLAVFVAGMAVKLFFFDLVAWRVGADMLYGGPDYVFLDGAMRLLDFGAIIAFLACGYYLLTATSGSDNARTAAYTFGAAAVALLFVFLTLEVNTFLYHYVPGLRAGGVSILWSMFALGLIVGGMWKDVRAVRYVGLALFAVVAGKVLLSDLAHLGSGVSDRRLHRFGDRGPERLAGLYQVPPDPGGQEKGIGAMTRCYWHAVCCVDCRLACCRAWPRSRRSSASRSRSTAARPPSRPWWR